MESPSVQKLVGSGHVSKEVDIARGLTFDTICRIEGCDLREVESFSFCYCFLK